MFIIIGVFWLKKLNFMKFFNNLFTTPFFHLADFNSEHPLYLKASALTTVLNDKPWNDNLSVKDNLIELYIDMYERNFIEHQDVLLLKVWLEHVYVYR